MIYCNLFRRQLERFETLFSNKDFFEVFLSFKTISEVMLLIFNEERKVNKSQKVIVRNEKEFHATFHEGFSRVKKWHVILS